MDCPRCGSELTEHEPDKVWKRYFRCIECCADWMFLGTDMIQGKRRSDQWLVDEALRVRH